jgi:Holliday junction resolvase
MRRANRRDLQHKHIVADLLKLGFSVADTSMVGDDFPDLVVGRNGMDRLVEIKSGKKIHHQSADLREGQEDFRQKWKGSRVIVAFDVNDVVIAFNDNMRGR